MKPNDIQRLIRNDGGGLREHIEEQPSNPDAFVVYETYRTNALKIVSSTGTDVSTKVEVSAELKPLSSASGNFKYKRSSKDTIVIQGDKEYVFAVRAAKLVWKNNAYVLDVTNFTTGDVKAIGGTEKYAAPIITGFDPVKFSHVKKGEKVSFPNE